MKKTFFLKNLRAFTAMEILIVTIVTGVLTAILLPKFPEMIENQKASTAKTALSNIHMSQRRYFIDNDEYAPDDKSLDVAATAPDGFNLTVSNNPTQLALMTRDTGAYTLSIASTRSIGCQGSGCSAINMGDTATFIDDRDPPVATTTPPATTTPTAETKEPPEGREDPPAATTTPPATTTPTAETKEPPEGREDPLAATTTPPPTTTAAPVFRK